MEIRRANKNDIKDLAKLLDQVLKVHHKGRPDLFKDNVRKYTDEELVTIIKDDNRPIFVALNEKNNVLGYAFCVIEETKNDNILVDHKTIYIDDLCVDENSRRQHVGKTLYEYVLKYAKEIGCYNVTLNVWGKNESAMKFYKSCGLETQKIKLEKIL